MTVEILSAGSAFGFARGTLDIETWALLVAGASIVLPLLAGITARALFFEKDKDAIPRAIAEADSAMFTDETWSVANSEPTAD